MHRRAAVGQVAKLAGDLRAVRLVILADLPDESAGALADLRAPFPELHLTLLDVLRHENVTGRFTHGDRVW